MERERKLNLNILSYQRDLQRQTDKLETQLQAVRAAESKISELDAQIKTLSKRLVSQQHLASGHLEKLQAKEAQVSQIEKQLSLLRMKTN